MIAKSNGFEFGDFWIPPFELNEGDLLSICLFGGAHFFPLENELVKLFTGQTTHPGIEMYEKMAFNAHIKISPIKDFFFPLTVGNYLRKNGSATVSDLKDGFGLDYISAKTKVRLLNQTHRRWISLVSMLSRTHRIVFDLRGQDQLSGEKTLDYIKKFTDQGGTAILFDNYESIESQVTKYLSINKIN